MIDAALPLTKDAALARLHAFVPRAGRAYAATRNHVAVDGTHDNVSRLSGALRRRLIDEEEAIAAAVAVHGIQGAEKFIAEVCWRTYWKGWLEQRPQVWRDWQAELAAERERLTTDAALARRHAAAIEGRTGIEAFDHWARELAETGYLHNWARMQVASIWLFTLGLPWALGAAWTYELLIDGDPASNTLSWRWVAGLHSAGKTYLADAARIAAMTGGRLSANGLATAARIPTGPPTPAVGPVRSAIEPDRTAPSLVLLTPEDGRPETLPLDHVVGVVAPECLWSRRGDDMARRDVANRASAHWSCPTIPCQDVVALSAIAQDRGARQIVSAFLPVGEVADTVRSAGIRLAEVRRAWDVAAWPHCTKGFFQLRARIPDLLAARGIVG